MQSFRHPMQQRRNGIREIKFLFTFGFMTECQTVRLPVLEILNEERNKLNANLATKNTDGWVAYRN